MAKVLKEKRPNALKCSCDWAAAVSSQNKHQVPCWQLHRQALNRHSITEDKVKAVQNLATSGRLEFDINGKFKTHLDIDLAADEPGVACVRVASELIPKLPYINLASSSSLPTGGHESAWNIVTNMGKWRVLLLQE